MSVSMNAWAEDQTGLGHVAKSILMRLAYKTPNNSHRVGVYESSVRRLAQVMELSEKAVRNAMNRLEKAGLIAKVLRPGQQSEIMIGPECAERAERRKAGDVAWNAPTGVSEHHRTNPSEARSRVEHQQRRYATKAHEVRHRKQPPASVTSITKAAPVETQRRMMRLGKEIRLDGQLIGPSDKRYRDHAKAIGV